MITLDDLAAICRTTPRAMLEKFVEPLSSTMLEFEISNPSRETAFLAQIAHESGGFRYIRELASGDAYEGRKDLGNTELGDGPRFRGRGLIQITGRTNYQACGSALGIDLIAAPELLERPDLAARSAGWFWQLHGLNELADKGDFARITKRINGGLNGYQDRISYWNRAQAILA